jgi:serine/threonine protein kinase
MPVLLEAGCDFKIIATPELLRGFNAGLNGAGAVGKAVTIYPNQETVVELAHRLADALTGFEGPQINSDRRLRLDAPVYYRFGPFSPRLQMNDAGRIDIMLKAPDGRMTSGLAGDTYSSPEWAEDPFGSTGTSGARLPRIDGALVIGDHYRIVGAIMRTHRGTSYRAVDRRSGLRVVVKQARAFVNETSEGDARTYLRNERRVLEALGGISGVSRVVDHFAYGNDEFLVTTDLGFSNLRDDVVDFGVFAWEANSPRNVFDLARAILRILDDVHQRGVIYRDLSPKNIVALADGGWGLVDFELSSSAGVQRYGWTPGYSHARQRRDEPGAIEDDYFSLGATMFHALTGLDPIIIDQNPDTNVARTVSCLTAICGADAPIVTIIKNLLDSDATVQANAVRKLRTTTALGTRRRATVVRRSPPLGPVFRHTLDAVLGHANAILADDVRKGDLPPPITAYAGTAGIVMELTQHPGALTTGSELARSTALIVERVDTPPSLLYGRMGISLALQAIANATGDVQLHRAADATTPGKDDVANEQRVDVTHGLAGLGIGYLAFAATASDPGPYRTLADQCAERLLLGEAMIDEQLRALPVGNVAHGISVADGFAHGRAGIAYFLLTHAAQSGHDGSRRQARKLIDALADLVPDLAARAQSPLARPMAASWCQGLAGIGTTLVRGARFFDDEHLLKATQTAAAGCLAIAPRVPLVTQCCGLAGIGEFLLDLAIVTNDVRYRRAALDTLNLMLLRSGGSPIAPCFPDRSMATSTPGWATGASGVLSFLRRLVDPSSLRLWMAESLREEKTKGVGSNPVGHSTEICVNA